MFSWQLDDLLRRRLTFAADGGAFLGFFVFVKAPADFGTKIEHFNMQRRKWTH